MKNEKEEGVGKKEPKRGGRRKGAEGEEKEELPPTHSILLVNVTFYSLILIDPLVIILIWVFPVEKDPVCAKPQ